MIASNGANCRRSPGPVTGQDHDVADAGRGQGAARLPGQVPVLTARAVPGVPAVDYQRAARGADLGTEEQPGQPPGRLGVLGDVPCIPAGRLGGARPELEGPGAHLGPVQAPPLGRVSPGSPASAAGAALSCEGTRFLRLGVAREGVPGPLLCAARRPARAAQRDRRRACREGSRNRAGRHDRAGPATTARAGLRARRAARRPGHRGAGDAGTNARTIDGLPALPTRLAPPWTVPKAVYLVPPSTATAVAPPAPAGQQSSPST